MFADLAEIDDLLGRRAHAALLQALARLEPKADDADWQRRALATLTRAYYQVGEFTKAVEFVHGVRARYRLPFHHPTTQNYIRSLITLRLEGGNSPDVAAQVIDGTLLKPLLEAVAHHFARAPEARDAAVHRCVEAVASFADLVALLNLLHYYAIPVASELARDKANLFPHSGQAAHAALRFAPHPDVAPPAAGRRYLFCGGAARSGTTAMGIMLNLSPQISLFTELYNPYLGYAAPMFDAEALHSDYFTRKPHFVRDVLQREKLGDQTLYVGDKRPLFLNSWNITRFAFSPKDVRIVNLVRGPGEVVDSYARRAVRARSLSDSWQSDRIGLLAESDLARQLEVIDEIRDSEFAASLKLVKYPDCLVDEDKIFELFEFLEVRLDSGLRGDVLAEIGRNREYLATQSSPVASDRTFAFLREAEVDRYRSLLAIGGR